MPAIYRTTDTTSTTAVIATSVSDLRYKISQRKRIRWGDVTRIRDAHNSWIGHFHSYYDQIFVKYGSLGGQPATASRWSSTAVVAGATYNNDTYTGGITGWKTLTNKIRALVLSFNSHIKSHYHQYTDS